jgi:hypothetical protein
MAMISNEERTVVLAEYNALRAEILALIQARNQFLIYDLTGFGVLFGLAVQQQNRIFFLVAPLIHFPLMLYWSYADRAIVKIGHYIREKIENRLDGMNWEKERFSERAKDWKVSRLPKLQQYTPMWLQGCIPAFIWKVRKLSTSELSGIATFAGSTTISLLLWISEPFLSGPIGKFNVFTAILIALDLAIFPLLFQLLRKANRDIAKYSKIDYLARLKSKGWTI